MYPTLIILILVQSQVYSACDANVAKKYETILKNNILPHIPNGSGKTLEIVECSVATPKTTLVLKFETKTCNIAYNTADEGKPAGQTQMKTEAEKCKIIDAPKVEEKNLDWGMDGDDDEDDSTGGPKNCGNDDTKKKILKEVMDSLKKTENDAKKAVLKKCTEQLLPNHSITAFEIEMDGKKFEGASNNEKGVVYLKYTPSTYPNLFAVASTSTTQCNETAKKSLFEKIKAKGAPKGATADDFTKTKPEHISQCFATETLSFVNLTVGAKKCRYIMSDIAKAMGTNCSDNRVI